MQENCNTSSEGAESQIRDGGRGNLEIDNRKSPPHHPHPALPTEERQRGTTFFSVSTNIFQGGKKEGKKDRIFNLVR